MTVSCQACHAPTDAHLCRPCTDCQADTQHRCGHCLTDLLAQLPAAITDLRTTATRQAKVGNLPPRLTATAIAELEQADAEERDVPARLRSKHGRVTLVATPSPVAYDAAELGSQARAGVLSWARSIATARDIPLPEGARHRRVAEHQAVTVDGELIEACTWTWQRTPVTLEWLCSWLIGNLDHVRQSDDAGRIYQSASSLTAWINRAVDRRPPDVFAGKCDAEDVRVDALPVLGAPCSGLTCGHETCQQIRGRVYRLAPRTVECGELLEAREGDTQVECPSCGTVYDVGERRAAAADDAADRLGTTREVAGFLRTITVTIGGQDEQLEVTVDRIDGWLRYGKIAARGTNPDGHRLVKIGEVREYAEDWQRRRAARRKRVAA